MTPLRRRDRSLWLVIAFLFHASGHAQEPTPPQAETARDPGLQSDSQQRRPERRRGTVLERVAEVHPSLSERDRDFLDQVALILRHDELDVFLQLDEEYQRAAFIRAFWRARDPFPETARNELLEAVEGGADSADDRFGDTNDDRRRWMSLHGTPTRTFTARCDVLRPLEIWYYQESVLVRAEYYLVFVRYGARYRLWSPAEGLYALMDRQPGFDERAAAQSVREQCGQSDQILEALALSLDWERFSEQTPLLRRSNPEWAQSFLARSTDVPEAAARLSAQMSVDYPGRYRSRTVMQAVIEVPRSEFSDPTPQSSAHFLLDGEILRAGELFESFRYRFDVPFGEAGDVPLVLQRYLRAGDYDLLVRVREIETERYFREQVKLEVPSLPARTARTRHHELALDETDLPEDLLLEANAQLDSTLIPGIDEEQPSGHTLRLSAPSDELQTGRLRVSAEVVGEGVDRVAFFLDDRPLLSKSRAPYSVEIDLGRAPRMHRLRGEALDDAGQRLAEDELVLNQGPHRFDVRLIAPQRGHQFRRSVRAVAEIEVPELERFDRLEFYLNETLLATVFQPPWVQPILVPPDLALAYVRAVGYLKDGTSSEDVVFVNAPDLIDEIDVDMVELYTTVVDRRGNLARELGRDDFVVREDGEKMPIRRFERVENLPIYAGILLDTSLSMEERLSEAEEAALYFFQRVLEEDDRACLITFNDQPYLAVPFTGSVEILAGGLSGLIADGETALWDSLIYALYYFGGTKGKRALIVLSDGEDSQSEYEFEEALEFSQRAGVAIYTIGLAISTRDMNARSRLSRLARETGGESFFIETAAGLKRVYEQIEEEVRSQYLLTYQSVSSGERDRFREVEVEVSTRGLKAKTMRGYYP